MALISLVYVSYATQEMSGEELKDLLEVCRRNNKPLNVTGMLLYRDGYFIQALEGEEDTVMDLYETIVKDPRHDRVLTVYKGEIVNRAFTDWSMGFRNLEDVDFSEYPEYTDFSQFSPEYFSNNPSRAKSLLKTFKDQTYY